MPPFVFTPYHHEVLADLLQSHSVADMCIIGPRGCGKSAVVAKMAHMLGYQTEPILVYQVCIFQLTSNVLHYCSLQWYKVKQRVQGIKSKPHVLAFRT